MLKPNVHCVIASSNDEYDRYGKALPGKERRSKCDVVKLVMSREKTSVRADSSASRGGASEILSDARLLFSPIESVSVGDKIVVVGHALRVVSIQPRFDVHGRIDHIEVDANIWA